MSPNTLNSHGNQETAGGEKLQNKHANSAMQHLVDLRHQLISAGVGRESRAEEKVFFPLSVLAALVGWCQKVFLFTLESA